MRYIKNPPNPYLSEQHDWLGEPPEAKLEVFEETSTKTIITRNNSPDIPFDYSINCYRGCTHACTYCFSRPTHEYLGWGAGTDFDTKITAKIHAPELLRKELKKKNWKGDPLIFSFTSDPYIPLEVTYQLTRKCLEVCLEYRNPVGIITKSALIRRDIDLIKRLSNEAGASVTFTIPFLNKEVNRAVEPYTPSPETRFNVMKEFSDAGIETGLAIAPVIPGLNDHEIPELLKRGREAGAQSAFITLLRLPGSVKPYFIDRLEEKLPLQAQKVLNKIKEVKGGALNKNGFGERMRGEGPYWDMIVQTFNLHHRKHGYSSEAKKFLTQRCKETKTQRSLFDM